jgi:DNA-binding NarL/FixJ family response regulator
VISIFLVAVSPRARRELESRLDGAEVEIAGSAPDVEMAADELLEKEADVVLISVGDDSREEFLQALEETRLARELPVVLLMEQGSVNLAPRAFRAGVRGILPAEVETDALSSALVTVVKGLVVLSLEEVGAIRSTIGVTGETAEAIEPLTPREREVLQKMASGLGNKEIAARMRISEHTAKFHVASILSKLGAASRTEAVSIGMRRGLILL